MVDNHLALPLSSKEPQTYLHDAPNPQSANNRSFIISSAPSASSAATAVLVDDKQVTPSTTIRTHRTMTRKSVRSNMSKHSSTSQLTSIQDKLRNIESTSQDFTTSTGLKGCLSTSNLVSLGDQHTTTDNNKRPSIKRSVSFYQVQVRSYERALGDNPSVCAGPAISLGWQHTETQSIGFQDYETNRPEPRTREQLRIPRKVREQLLRNEWGVTQRELQSAVKDTNIVRNQRRSTAASTESVEKTKDMLRTTSRKFKKIFAGGTKSVKKEEKLLWNQAYKAAMQKSRSMSDLMQQRDEEESPEIRRFSSVKQPKHPADRSCYSSVDLSQLASEEELEWSNADAKPKSAEEGDIPACGNSDEWGFFGIDEADE